MRHKAWYTINDVNILTDSTRNPTKYDVSLCMKSLNTDGVLCQ